MKGIENFNKAMVCNTVKPVDFSSCKELFEKFGERRLFCRDEYFVRSGEVMKSVG